MKTINTLFLIPLAVSMGVATVSIAEVSQHPTYPSDEGSYVTGNATNSIAGDTRVNFSLDARSISIDKVSQHPFYPSDDANHWTDATGTSSRVNFSMESALEHTDELSQHSVYPFDE